MRAWSDGLEYQETNRGNYDCGHFAQTEFCKEGSAGQRGNRRSGWTHRDRIAKRSAELRPDEYFAIHVRADDSSGEELRSGVGQTWAAGRGRLATWRSDSRRDHDSEYGLEEHHRVGIPHPGLDGDWAGLDQRRAIHDHCQGSRSDDG